MHNEATLCKRGQSPPKYAPDSYSYMKIICYSCEACIDSETYGLKNEW